MVFRKKLPALRREVLISNASCQKNQIKVTGLGGKKRVRPRTSACNGEIWNCRNALEQADRMAYICSVAPLTKNCRVIYKNICHKISKPIVREKTFDLCKPWGIALLERMDVRIKSHVL